MSAAAPAPVLPRPVPRSRPARSDVPVPSHQRLAGVSIVLPCLDEEANVAQAVAEALAAGTRCACAVEVIVVDDGSRDQTRAVAEGLAGQDPRVRVVGHDVNRGYGAAVRSGITASRMPWVLLTDADLQFDLQELDAMLAPAEDHDIVAGYRIGRQDPVHRRAAAHAWNRLMRRTFAIPVRDVDCAFKLVRGPAVRQLPLCSAGAMISTELYARACGEGWTVAEVGVHHRARQAGEATGGKLSVVLRAFRERRVLARALRGGADAAARTGARPRAVLGRPRSLES